MGIHIHQVVPPRIAQISIPIGMNSSSLEGVEKAYTGAIEINDIRALGPMAVASALQWNKSQRSTMTSGAVGNRSLDEAAYFDAPTSLNLANLPSEIRVEWNPVEGAYFYEIQAADNAAFSAPKFRTVTERTSVRLPADLSQTQTLYVRVRAGERSALDGSTADKMGSWSGTRSISVPVPATTPTSSTAQTTSPVDGFQSTGFSVVLEWISPSPSRLQVSKDSNFQTTLVDQITDENEFTPPSSALHVGERLYWRVQGWDRSLSPWSQARSLQVTEPRASNDDSFVNPEAPR
jgi:hypothetical protein